MLKPLDIDLSTLVNDASVPTPMQFTFKGQLITLADVLPRKELGEDQAVILEQPPELVERLYQRVMWTGTQQEWDAHQAEIDKIVAANLLHQQRLATDPAYDNEQWLARMHEMNPGLVDAHGEFVSLHTPIAMTEDGRLVVYRPQSQLGDTLTGKDRPDMPELDR